MESDTRRLVAGRIRSLRTERGLSQEELASALGFKSRQILQKIEQGERAVSPEELVLLARHLDVELGTFTDRFRLVGEEVAYSFRVTRPDPDDVEAFQDVAGTWLATYRELLRSSRPETLSRLRYGLDLRKTSSFEDAQQAASDLIRAWALGDRPATRLVSAIEEQLSCLVMFVDMPEGVSGAATVLDELRAIFVNRTESPGRRSFDLAHELFHVLTWSSMPPKEVESVRVSKKKGNRVEQLAENFAAALLMPAEVVSTAWQKADGVDLHDWLNAEASQFEVSSDALAWRLVNLGLMSRAERESLDAGLLRNHGGEAPSSPPRPFSERFVQVIAEATNEGVLSLRRAMRLLGLGEGDLLELFRSHGVQSVYDSVPSA